MIRQKEIKSFSWVNLIKSVWFLMEGKRRVYLFWTLLLFVVNFYVIVPPLLVGKIVDFFHTYQSGQSLMIFYLYTFALGASFVAVSFTRLSVKRAMGNLQSEMTMEAKVKGFEKLMDFSMAWHTGQHTGAKSTRIQNGVDAFRRLSSSINNEIMRSVTTVIGVIGVFIFLQPSYVIFFLIYVVGFWGILQFFYQRIQRENESYYIAVEGAGGSYVEGLSNIMTIKTLGARKSFTAHVAEKENRTKAHEYMMRTLYNNLWKMFQAFNGICYGVFLYMVGRGVIAGVITPGSLVVFYGYLQSLTGSATDMLDTYETLLSTKSGVGRMMEIFWTKSGVKEGTKNFPKSWDRLQITNGNFTYIKRGDSADKIAEETISDLSLTIHKFEKIGVVGATGSGKSTVAKILMGLYPLNSGSYSIGTTSFYDLKHEEQTKEITLVLQESEMFNLSLRDNVTLMRKTSPELLQTAIEVSQLSEVVAKLSEGLDTLIGEKGYHLSGGERQRVGIARAICKNSQILIFDEATSSLDSRTEFRIQRSLEKYLKKKTIIIIAHRVSTLQNVDTIYVFDGGKVVESGSFDELSKNTQSKFYELYKVQSKSKDR